jgi:hypothetical protein
MNSTGSVAVTRAIWLVSTPSRQKRKNRADACVERSQSNNREVGEKCSLLIANIHLILVRSMTRILAIVLSLIGGALLAQQNHPADGMQAPDKIHSVAIVHSALPGSDLYDGFFTIEVRRDGRALSRYPTCGFLVDVLWSPNGKYVAVRNRRGTSGDYTWVFRLSDGHAVKQPDDEGSAKD